MKIAGFWKSFPHLMACITNREGDYISTLEHLNIFIEGSLTNAEALFCL